MEVVQDPKVGRDCKRWRSSLRCCLSFQVSVLVEFVSCLDAIIRSRGDGKAPMVIIWCDVLGSSFGVMHEDGRVEPLQVLSRFG